MVLSTEAFLQQLSAHFDIEKRPDAYRPESAHDFGMYLDKQWYKLIAKPHTYDDSAVGQLDVTVLSKHVLEPIFNIVNLRTDERIDFVGGMRGLQELERRVNSGEMRIAFALYPITMQQVHHDF